MESAESADTEVSWVLRLLPFESALPVSEKHRMADEARDGELIWKNTTPPITRQGDGGGDQLCPRSSPILCLCYSLRLSLNPPSSSQVDFWDENDGQEEDGGRGGGGDPFDLETFFVTTTAPPLRVQETVSHSDGDGKFTFLSPLWENGGRLPVVQGQPVFCRKHHGKKDKWEV
jgi:hypothetical protein